MYDHSKDHPHPAVFEPRCSSVRRTTLALLGKLAATTACTLLSIGMTQAAQATEASYPNRPVKLIVPFSPGGGADIVGRIVANALGQELGQSVVVENRGGAASIIGTDAGAKAKPDGYTLVITNGAAITVGPMLGQPITYDPVEDFEHIFLIGTFPNGLLVNANHPAKTFQEFIELARQSKRKFNYGSAGVGSAGYLTGELLKQRAGVEMVHVPYKGTGPAMNDLIGGQLDALFNNLQAAETQAKAGNIRILAVSSPERHPQFPDVPTMDEIVPGTVAEAWFGISGPKGIPSEIIDHLEKALANVLKDESVRKQLAAVGMTPRGERQQQFAQFIQDEISKWGPVIQGIKGN